MLRGAFSPRERKYIFKRTMSFFGPRSVPVWWFCGVKYTQNDVLSLQATLAQLTLPQMRDHIVKKELALLITAAYHAAFSSMPVGPISAQCHPDFVRSTVALARREVFDSLARHEAEMLFKILAARELDRLQALEDYFFSQERAHVYRPWLEWMAGDPMLHQLTLAHKAWIVKHTNAIVQLREYEFDFSNQALLTRQLLLLDMLPTGQVIVTANRLLAFLPCNFAFVRANDASGFHSALTASLLFWLAQFVPAFLPLCTLLKPEFMRETLLHQAELVRLSRPGVSRIKHLLAEVQRVYDAGVSFGADAEWMRQEIQRIADFSRDSWQQLSRKTRGKDKASKYLYRCVQAANDMSFARIYKDRLRVCIRNLQQCDNADERRHLEAFDAAVVPFVKIANDALVSTIVALWQLGNQTGRALPIHVVVDLLLAAHHTGVGLYGGARFRLAPLVQRVFDQCRTLKHQS